ncbi:hypothetical protein [Roseovarius mucosus]|uniref:hypothetical protein n=1 Tax=Roseovarius mucosus TaxID=215743 RepID=UPI0035CF71BA
MYGTVAGWITYAGLRGLTVADTAASAQALVRASDYIRTRYVMRFLADYDDTAPEVEEATYIAAAFELTTPGFWATTFTPSQVKVLTEVKGIKWTPVTSGKGDADDMLPTSPAIEALLVPLTRWGMPAVSVI